MRGFILNLVISFVTMVVLLTVMEVFLRAYCQLKYKIPFFALTTAQKNDDLLRWNGLKIMGDARSGKLKVFFVGDSFTYRGSSSDVMYFDVVKHSIDIELFVFGGGGYSTMQEYLVIDKYIDEIKPDLIVLQTCSNDFINNSWNLERKSYVHNNSMVRPYYENGEIHYRFPRGPVFLRQYIIPYSRLGYFIADRVDRILAGRVKKDWLETVENDIQTRGLKLGEFEKAVSTTAKLIEMIKERCGKTRIIAFPVFDDEPYLGQFKVIFDHAKIDFLSDIPRLAWDAEGRGRVRNNSHWYKKGHAACGVYLAKYIKDNFLNNTE